MNWRIHLLALMACAALMLATSEAEEMKAFVLSKLLALSVGIATYLLGRYWNKKGQINFDELEE